WLFARTSAYRRKRLADFQFTRACPARHGTAEEYQAMTFLEHVVAFFKEGGPFLYMLAAIFVVGVAIAIERFIYLTKETTVNRRIWAQVVPLINQGNFRQVIATTQRSSAAIATALNYGISRLATARRRDDIEKA